MKSKNVIRLEKFEDLESYVTYLNGRYHPFIKHRTTPGIYILDLRLKDKKTKWYDKQTSFGFKAGYGKR